LEIYLGRSIVFLFQVLFGQCFVFIVFGQSGFVLRRMDDLLDLSEAFTGIIFAQVKLIGFGIA